MNKFLFKSTDADLQKLLQSIETKLDTETKNVLYITYQTDKIIKIVRDLENMSKMQKKIEEFYEETSPQTDTDEQ